MSKVLRKLLLAMMLMFVLALTACSGSGDDKESADKEEQTGEEKTEVVDDGAYSIEDFSNVKTNQGEAIKGGNFTFGLVSDIVLSVTAQASTYMKWL